MVRRRRRRTTTRRRRRRSSFFPLVLRVAAIVIIGCVIYYFTRSPAQRQEISSNIATKTGNITTKIGDKTAQVGDATKATLTNSKDVLVSAASTGAKSVANSAQIATTKVAGAAAVVKSGMTADVARVSSQADSVVKLLSFRRNSTNARPIGLRQNTTAAANVSTGGETFLQPRTQDRTRQHKKDRRRIKFSIQ